MSRKWKAILILSLLCNVSIGYVAYKALEYRNHINYFLDKYNQVVDEFSGQAEYAESNRSLVSATQVPGRIVFLGTQVTRNWNLERYFEGYETVNRGISGQRVAGFLLRFRSDVIDLFPQAVVIEVSSYNFRPNITVRQIEEYVASMAELARANSIEPVLTTVIPPRIDFSVYEHEDYVVKDSVMLYNDWLLDFASDDDYQCADFCGAVSDTAGFLRSDCSTSRVDLNEKGYELISQVALGVLNTLE